MIFATVGTQLPFDRLIRALDDWAQQHADTEVFAQVGNGSYEPRHIGWSHELHPQKFRNRLETCDTIVAHAGMGTIISGIELGKRVIVMPRRAQLGEHRNEHQLATVARLGHLQGLEVVHDAAELGVALSSGQLSTAGSKRAATHPELIETVRQFAGLEAV
jgi:UDP-N-acetylglucosamine transferase subunit ALG13